MATPTIERSLRRGALLAGVPLALLAVLPTINGGVHFTWADIGDIGISAIIFPLAGIVMILAAAIPGLPRLVRALMIMGAVGGVVAVLGPEVLFYATDSLPIDNLVGGLEEWRFYLLFGCFLVTPIFEFMAQGKKASGGFAVIGLLGWAIFVSNFVLPIGGVVPVVGVIGLIGELLEDVGGIIFLAVFVILLVMGVAGLVFSLLRIFKSPQDRLNSWYRSGWAGVFIAGFFGIVSFVFGAILMIDSGHIPGLTMVFHGAAMVWGLILGAAVGVAHLVLGFFPDEAAAEPTGQAGPVYQPAAAQQPAPAQQQGWPGQQPQQQGWPGQQPQPQENQVQRFGQPQGQPAFPAKPAPPSQPKPEPYPGYPGYFMCPKCRGGVQQGAGQCSHCGANIQW